MVKHFLSRIKWDIAAIAFLCAATLFLFRDFLATGGLVSAGDLTGSGYPILDFFGAEMRAGRLPIWNPYAGGGQSLLGVVTPTFYPPGLLFVVLPTALAVGWSYILAVVIAGSGAYLLGRQLGVGRSSSLIAGLSFMFSGYLFNRLLAGHFASFQTMVWLPWVLLFAERALVGRLRLNVVWGGLALAIHFSAALPAEYINIVAALVIYPPLRALLSLPLMRKMSLMEAITGLSPSREGPIDRLGFRNRVGLARAILIVVLILGIGAALAAPVLVPLGESVAVSVRGSGLNYGEATLGSLTLPHLLAFPIRNLFGSEADGTGWYGWILHETTGYFGVLSLALAVCAVVWRRGLLPLIFAALAGFALLISLGGNTPVYQFLYMMPPFNLVRTPPRFLWLYVFAGAMLAGLGADSLRMLTYGGLIALRSRLVFSAFLVAVVIGIMAAGLQVIPLPPDMEPTRLVIPWIMARGGFATILILIVGAFLIHWRAHGLGDRALVGGLIVIVVADLISYDQSLVKINDPRMIYAPNRTISFLQERPGLYRVMDLGHTLAPYAGTLDRQVQDVESDWPMTYQRYWEWVYQDVDHPRGIPGDSRGELKEYFRQVARLLNVRYVFADHPLEEASLELISTFVDGQRQTYYWPGPERQSPVWAYEVKDALPRAFAVHRVAVAPDRQAAFRTVADPSFDPRSIAVLEEQFDAVLSSDPPPSTEANVVEYEPARIRVQVDMPAAGLLVLSEVNYPGWVARVDGTPARIWAADYLLRAVYLSAGPHEVEMTYEPASLRLGMVIGGVSLAGVGLYLGFAGIRRLPVSYRRRLLPWRVHRPGG